MAKEIQFGFGFTQRDFRTGDRVGVGGPTPEDLEKIASSPSVDNNAREIPIRKEHEQSSSIHVNKQKYLDFLTELRSMDIPVSGYGRWKCPDAKKSLLRKYFPGQFSKQDLSKYVPVEVGLIFERLYLEALKHKD